MSVNVLNALSLFQSRVLFWLTPMYSTPPPPLPMLPTPQTLKDVSRERFDVNKEPTDPCRCWSRIRSLLLDAAVQNSKHNQQNQAPVDRTARPADAAALQPDTGGPRIASDSAASATASSPVTRAKKTKGVPEAAVAEGCQAVGEAQLNRRSGPTAGADAETTSPADAAAGGNGLGLESVSGGSAREVEGGGGKKEVDAKGEGSAPGGAEGGGSVSKSPVEVYVDQCAWRVLHAASRTASGGDSFFVVQVR